MEQIFIEATVHENEYELFGYQVEIKRYVPLDEDSGRGRIVESRLYECVKRCPSLRIGCYSVRVTPKKNCQIWLHYDKGRLTIFMDKKEELVGDLKKDFLVSIVETEKVRIEIEFC